MNDLITKHTQRLTEIRDRQEKILVAADVEGTSEDDRTRLLAEFDQLDAEKKRVQASVDRARALDAEQKAAAMEAERRAEADRTTPSKPPIQPEIYRGETTPPTVGRVTVPANVRRVGPLKAFKGADADIRAYQAGLWVAARMYGHAPSLNLVRDYGIEQSVGGFQATMSGTDNNKGGYFVPDVLSMTVLELQEQYGVIRRLADVEPMASETWSGPRWTNSMTAYWVSQGNAPTQSEPGWDRIELAAKDLAAYGKMTAQLNEDALINLGDKWAMAAAVAFNYAEDNAAFNGDGTSTYGGITGLLTKIVAAANAASLYTATGHATLGALTMGDFNAVIGKFPNYPGAEPVWLCHKEVYANSMLGLQMAAGGVTARDIQEGGKPMFGGYPVEFVNVMPKAASVTTGVTGILFADLSLSTKFGDRRQRRLRTGEINDDMIKQLITLFAASRVDINNHTITDPKSSSNPGPVIGLKLG